MTTPFRSVEYRRGYARYLCVLKLVRRKHALHGRYAGFHPKANVCVSVKTRKSVGYMPGVWEPGR